MFTTPRIGSVFISFVSFSFNKHHVSVPTRTCIRVIGEIRVRIKRQSKIRVQIIRVIRVITSLRSVGLRRISCSKHLVRASKFIIGQFHIAASRNNSTFNIQNSTLRSAPPCAKEYSCYSLYYLPTVSGPTANLVFKTSRESIEIHHWSIPHCGQPQQFNIQHSKLNIALRASVCKRIFVLFALLPPYGQWAYGESRVQNIS